MRHFFESNTGHIAQCAPQPDGRPVPFFLGSAEAVTGEFDLILANLHAVIHRELFDHYQRLLPFEGDLLVVSGFYDVHSDEVKTELAQRGFEVVERTQVHASAPALAEEISDTWVGFGLKRVS